MQNFYRQKKVFRPHCRRILKLHALTPGGATYLCALDKQPAERCTTISANYSPAQTRHFSTLALGQPSRCLPHGLPGIHSSPSSPDTAMKQWWPGYLARIAVASAVSAIYKAQLFHYKTFFRTPHITGSCSTLASFPGRLPLHF